MVSGLPLAIFAIVVGIFVLWFAVRYGTIGGGGAGANRNSNPFNYWFGVWFTAALLFVMILVLIGRFVQPDRFRF